MSLLLLSQGGPDAALKKVYSIDLGDYSWEDGTVLEKTLYKDLIESGDLSKTNGQIIEKVEGLTVAADGSVWINTDNDGVDDSSGESLLTTIGVIESEESSSSGSIFLMTALSCLAPLVAVVAGL